MNVGKVKKQLKKINTLFANIHEEGSYNKIEKDLLKTYVLELYEKIIIEGDEAKKESTPKAKKESTPKAKKESTSKIRKEFKYKEVPNEKGTTSIAKEESIFDESVPETSFSKPIYAPLNTEEKKYSNGFEKIAEQPIIKTMVEEPEIEVIDMPVENEVIEVLFAENGANSDLSSHLSSRPISDLNHGMGLNERIFTINELFAGDQAHFAGVITSLNNFDSFAEAKNYLVSEVVNKFDWTSDKKMKKAANFIKIVKRRYV